MNNGCITSLATLPFTMAVKGMAVSYAHNTLLVPIFGLPVVNLWAGIGLAVILSYTSSSLNVKRAALITINKDELKDNSSQDFNKPVKEALWSIFYDLMFMGFIFVTSNLARAFGGL